MTITPSSHARRISSRVIVRDSDPLVREHRVHDIHVLPGVAMLDAIYKTLAAAGRAADSVVLRELLFHEPVVTHDALDRLLTITLTLRDEQGEIAVSSVPCREGTALSDERTLHLSGRIAAQPPADSLLALPPETAGGPAEPVDRCYAVTRRIGIHHDDFMQCRGSVAPLAGGRCIAQLALGERAAACASDFLLHPVFLDAATIVPLFPLRKRSDEASLFIPFAIDEFRAAAGFTGQRRIQVRVDASEFERSDQEILRYSMTLYAEDGRALARFGRFAVKRVRSLKGLLRLQAAGTSGSPKDASAEATTTAPPRPETKPASASADMLAVLIGSLVSEGSGQPWQPADAARPFFDLGLDSLALLDMAEALERQLGVRLYPTLLFECPTAAKLADHLRQAFPAEVAAALIGTSAAPTVRVDDPAPAHADPRRDARQTLTLVPRWLPTAPESPDLAPGLTVALISDSRWSAVDAASLEATGHRLAFQSQADSLAERIAEFGRAWAAGLRPDAVWLLEVDHEAAFVLIRHLLAAGAAPPAGLQIKSLSVDAFPVHRQPPAAAAVHGTWGLLQSLSREHPAIGVAQVDVASVELGDPRQPEHAAAALAALARMPCRPGQRRLRALRESRLYARALLEATPPTHAEGGFRTRGVYLVIGGAGGVGMAFVQHLRRRHDARIAVIGRRPLDEALHARLQAAGEYGRDIVYVQADTGDATALRRAIRDAEQRLGPLHGIVHAAMVLDDRRLAEMDAASYASVLAPKVDGMRALGAATAGMRLDWLLVFSSMQSYVGNAAQGNYAAASTYLDGYAASLRAGRSHPVRVINWGYWGEHGAVATPLHRELMARQGVHGLPTETALQHLEAALAAGWDDALILAADDDVLGELGWQPGATLAAPDEHRRIALPLPEPRRAADLQAQATAFAATGLAMEQLLAPARRRIATLLHERGVTPAAADQSALVQALQRETAGVAPGLHADAFSTALDGLAEAHADLRPFIPLLRASVLGLPALLEGRASGASLLFPNGSTALVRAVYADNALSGFYNQVVADAVCTLGANHMADGRPLRILEIGAGTGATTEAVLQALQVAGIACEYRYTDLWDTLVAEARQRLGPRFPTLRFGFIDIGRDPVAQGCDEAAADVIVATNVLHATRDLHQALRHAKRLLAPGGVLLINESVEVQSYSTLTFGLLPGWWHATDAHDRLSGSPLADARTWTRLLHDEGFVDVTALIPGADETPALAAQQVLVARSDGELRGPASLAAAVTAVPAAALSATTPATAAIAIPVAIPTPGALPAAAPAAGAAAPGSPSPSADEPRLPASLAGRLRPLALSGATPRHLRLFADDAGHPWLFLNRPPANAFHAELLDELCAALEGTGQRRGSQWPQGRLVYLSHFGEYFSLGGDRAEIVQRLAAGHHDELAAFAHQAARLLRLLAGMDSIVVAVVNGTAQGGGLETLFATDLQLVGEHVQLGLPEIRSGLIPGMGGLSYLQSQIGTARTKRLVMLGELIDAREAQALGLVTHVSADPFAAALELPKRLTHLGTAVRMKQILAAGRTERHTEDIAAWLHHLLHDGAQIDTRRIENAGLLLQAKSAASLLPQLPEVAA